jgi:hypothetical protein
MEKRHVFVFLLIAMLTVVVVLNLSSAGADASVACSSQDEGVVEKAQGDAFTVTIAFQNTGRAQGNWSVNVSFEGENWSWQGTPKTLTLEADGKKTLVWNGVVPVNASINSIARLVVYYGDSFKALDWWIRVVQPAELTIKSSSVS